MLKAGSGVGLLAPAARAIVVDRMNGTRVREMLRSVVARMTLAAGMAAAGGAEAFAWWDRCDCDAMRYGYYGPAPVYVYDHNARQLAKRVDSALDGGASDRADAPHRARRRPAPRPRRRLRSR